MKKRSQTASIEAVLDFWFADSPRDPVAARARQRRWFAHDADFDTEIRSRFATLLDSAARGEMKSWSLSAEGRLALILLFDQFSRNIHRGLAKAFAYDARALALCRDGLVNGHDQGLGLVHRLFFYLPLEHAEDSEAQARSVACFTALHESAPEDYVDITANALQHAREHQALIARFGRFPHRNLALERVSTPDEQAWLVDNARRYGQAG